MFILTEINNLASKSVEFTLNPIGVKDPLPQFGNFRAT